LTFFLIGAFFLAIIAGIFQEWPMTWPVALPMAGLSLNLAAAIATNTAFRRQLPLLVFHVALLILSLLVVASRLTYLKASSEVAVGGEFSGLERIEAGPWHAGRIDAVRFRNDGFTVAYSPGPVFDRVTSTVSWVDEAGAVRSMVIGANLPLVLHTYRFYPTTNKGFSPQFLWLPTGAAAVRGAVNLPAWPAHADRQSRDWVVPGTNIPLWTQLQFSDEILSQQAPSEFRTPNSFELVMRSGDERWTMRPGERHALPGGTLVFERLGTWMGYQVFYDWTLPWLLAVSLLAVASLSWHFWQKFSARPW
jgi:cytochrome c biogenesis protein